MSNKKEHFYTFKEINPLWSKFIETVGLHVALTENTLLENNEFSKLDIHDPMCCISGEANNFTDAYYDSWHKYKGRKCKTCKDISNQYSYMAIDSDDINQKMWFSDITMRHVRHFNKNKKHRKDLEKRFSNKK